MESYGAAAATAGRAAVSMPIQKRVAPLKAILQPPPPKAPVGSASPSPKVWPPAPEQSPQFAPQTHPLFPAAPVMPPWPVAPQTAAPSPFTAVPDSAWQTSPPPERLRGDEVSPPTVTMRQDIPERSPFQDLAMTREAHPPSSGEEDSREAWQAPQDERNVPLGLFILLVMGLGGWLAWESSRPGMMIEFPAPRAPTEQASPAEMPKEDPAPISQSMPVEPEVRKAEMAGPGETAEASSDNLPDLDLVAAARAAETLLRGLFQATTEAERMAVVERADEHHVEMAEFFAKHAVSLKMVRTAQELPRTLPGQEFVPLFYVETDVNPETGALLQLAPQRDGSFLLEWPLFAETHEQGLKRFLQTSSEQPSWHSVLLKRSHAIELPDEVRRRYFCVELRGSADDSIHCLAMVPLDTSLARFMEKEVGWGVVYVTRLLLQHRQMMGGGEGIVILDCEGAVTGAVFPSGSVKD